MDVWINSSVDCAGASVGCLGETVRWIVQVDEWIIGCLDRQLGGLYRWIRVGV